MSSKKKSNDADVESRRNFNKGLIATAATLVGGGVALTIYRHFSDDDLYARATNDPVLQERWIRRILSKYDIEDMFSQYIIVTQENAHKYVREYNRNEKVRQTSADIVVAWHASLEDLGTLRAPKPKLYVPTELFRLGSEGDLESTIAFHEASHGRVIIVSDINIYTNQA